MPPQISFSRLPVLRLELMIDVLIFFSSVLYSDSTMVSGKQKFSAQDMLVISRGPDSRLGLIYGIHLTTSNHYSLADYSPRNIAGATKG